MVAEQPESPDWGLIWGRSPSSSAIAYLAGCFERTPAQARIEPASANLILVVLLQGSISVACESGRSRYARAFVCPPRAGHVEVSHPGSYRAIEIGLPHAAARSLWSASLGELGASIYALDALAPTLARELHDRLDGARGWDRAFAEVEAVLRAVSPREVDPRLREARRLIQHFSGKASVDLIAKQVGWSRRFLAARFVEEFGIRPKAASRIARFERAGALLRHGARPAAVASECGYCDQAHMNRDFRMLGGSTPREWTKRALAPLESAWIRETSGP